MSNAKRTRSLNSCIPPPCKGPGKRYHKRSRASYSEVMKLTLVRGPEVVANSANAITTPPVGVAYLAAFARAAGHGVKVVDALGEAIFQYTPLFEEERGLALH